MQMSILTEWICIEGSPWFSGRNQGLVRDFAERLRAKLAMATSAAVVSDNEWEVVYLLQMGDQAASVRSANSMSLCSAFCLTYMRYYSYYSKFATHMEGSVATMESKTAGCDNRMI